MVTQKDFKAVAKIIANNTERVTNSEYGYFMAVRRDVLMLLLANYFATSNPRFDRERFMQACGLEQTQEAENIKTESQSTRGQ